MTQTMNDYVRDLSKAQEAEAEALQTLRDAKRNYDDATSDHKEAEQAVTAAETALDEAVARAKAGDYGQPESQHIGKIIGAHGEEITSAPELQSNGTGDAGSHLEKSGFWTRS